MICLETFRNTVEQPRRTRSQTETKQTIKSDPLVQIPRWRPPSWATTWRVCQPFGIIGTTHGCEPRRWVWQLSWFWCDGILVTHGFLVWQICLIYFCSPNFGQKASCLEGMVDYIHKFNKASSWSRVSIPKDGDNRKAASSYYQSVLQLHLILQSTQKLVGPRWTFAIARGASCQAYLYLLDTVTVGVGFPERFEHFSTVPGLKIEVQQGPPKLMVPAGKKSGCEVLGITTCWRMTCRVRPQHLMNMCAKDSLSCRGWKISCPGTARGLLGVPCCALPVPWRWQLITRERTLASCFLSIASVDKIHGLAFYFGYQKTTFPILKATSKHWQSVQREGASLQSGLFSLLFHWGLLICAYLDMEWLKAAWHFGDVLGGFLRPEGWVWINIGLFDKTGSYLDWLWTVMKMHQSMITCKDDFLHSIMYDDDIDLHEVFSWLLWPCVDQSTATFCVLLLCWSLMSLASESPCRTWDYQTNFDTKLAKQDRHFVRGSSGLRDLRDLWRNETGLDFPLEWYMLSEELCGMGQVKYMKKYLIWGWQTYDSFEVWLFYRAIAL